MRELQCRDAGFDCDAVVRGESDEDILTQAGPHVRDAHGLDVTPEMAEAIRGKVRDVPA